jgi:hypothetical protein
MCHALGAAVRLLTGFGQGIPSSLAVVIHAIKRNTSLGFLNSYLSVAYPYDATSLIFTQVITSQPKPNLRWIGTLALIILL